MKLSKSELLELLVEVIKHDYSLEKLGAILEIIDVYKPKENCIFRKLNPIEPLLCSEEEEEEDSESSDSSSVAVYLTEGEEESSS